MVNICNIKLVILGILPWVPHGPGSTPSCTAQCLGLTRILQPGGAGAWTLGLVLAGHELYLPSSQIGHFKVYGSMVLTLTVQRLERWCSRWDACLAHCRPCFNPWHSIKLPERCQVWPWSQETKNVVCKYFLCSSSKCLRHVPGRNSLPLCPALLPPASGNHDCTFCLCGSNLSGIMQFLLFVAGLLFLRCIHVIALSVIFNFQRLDSILLTYKLFDSSMYSPIGVVYIF